MSWNLPQSKDKTWIKVFNVKYTQVVGDNTNNGSRIPSFVGMTSILLYHRSLIRDNKEIDKINNIHMKIIFIIFALFII